jgi:Ca2+-binding EF-hand superfamily protein
VTHIHSENTCPPPMVLSKERVSRAAVTYSALNSNEEGLIPLKALKPVFSELGSDLTEDDMKAIAMELEIDMCTLLSFPEVADIAAYLSTSSQSSRQKAADCST